MRWCFLSLLSKSYLFNHWKSAYCLRKASTCTWFPDLQFENNRRLRELLKCGKLNEARHLFDGMPERDEYSWNTMVSGYANAGRFTEAWEVFNETPCKSSITWNSLISGYCHHGWGNNAFELFWRMQYDGFKPTEFTVGSILGICSKLGLLRWGEQLHSYAVKTLLHSNVFVVTALVDMYAKCNCILEAECAFRRASGIKSHLLWTAMLSGYSHNGYGHEAMECFRDLHVEGIGSNQFTFPSILAAVASVEALNFGRQVHGCIIKCGLDPNVFVQSALLDMYGRCRDFNNARLVLATMEVENVTAWNSMIVTCVREGFEEEALLYFKKMHALNLKIDDFTYPSILKCLTLNFDLKVAWSLHCLAIKTGYEDYNIVSNALIGMYGKQGDVDSAIKGFNKMLNKDMVSWTSLVSGYSQNGLHEEALQLFNDMRTAGVYLDDFLFSCVLGACAELTVLQFGQQVHAIFVKSGGGLSLSVDNCLISMYAKCGCMEEALIVFDLMEMRDLISWTSMIVGYAQNGEGTYSIKFYEEMLASGIEPDSVTFVGLLFACSHAGLVEKGQCYFESMEKVYGIKPGQWHYACIIDLLGRSGKMMEANKILNEMVVEPDASIWKALLAACRLHGNIETAERAARNLFELEPQNAVPYILLANIYSAAGKWQEAARTRRSMRSKAIIKEPGRSWIEMEGKVHKFTSADKSHPRTLEIYAKVDEIILLIRKAGYVPNKNFALHDTDDMDKELALAYHCEKLAVAFGLLVLPPRLPIRVFKNIRVCGDCHTAMKFISEVYHRHIILRDSNRFHHFQNGLCSCNDYW